jgi:hypothetical protein
MFATPLIGSFVGDIPDMLGQLTCLTSLGLSSNRLEGMSIVE